MKFANAPFTYVITPTMICRLILNLRRAGTPRPIGDEISSISFAQAVVSHRTFLGNFGEDMDVDDLNYKKRMRVPMRGEAAHIAERNAD